ncbi:MAG: thioredoxin family protein [Promethearchaeota archaeon]
MSKKLPEEIIEIESIDQFNELVEKYRDSLIVIDFWAPWCGPCKMFHPVFINAQKKWKDYFIFVRVNTEKLPEISEHLGIMSIPTIGFVKKQKLIYSHSGSLRRREFDQLLDLVKQNIDNESQNISSMYS